MKRLTSRRRALQLLALVPAGYLLACAANSKSSGASGGTSAGSKNAGASGGKPTTVAQIALYRGSDRQQMLEAGAKDEGKFVWYTGTIVQQLVQPLIDGFKKKYPYLSADYYRDDTGPLLQKLFDEYQAGHFAADICDGTGAPPLLRQHGMIQSFYSPPLDAYPADLKDKDGYWGTYYQSFLTLGYNTKLVQKQDLPRSYEDLADPKWKGKMAMSTSSTSGGAGLVGIILDQMGQDKGMALLNQLAKQNIKNIDSAARSVLDQVIAGQFPIALQIFNYHATISAEAGAPADWAPLAPAVIAQAATTSLLNKAPHPHAALLFYDFLFSEEGAAIIRDHDYIPTNPAVDAKVPTLKPDKGGYKARFFGPEELNDKLPGWLKTYQSLFLK